MACYLEEAAAEMPFSLLGALGVKVR